MVRQDTSSSTSRVTRSQAPIIDLIDNSSFSKPQPEPIIPARALKGQGRKRKESDGEELVVVGSGSTSAKAKGKAKAKARLSVSNGLVAKKQKRKAVASEVEEKRLSRWRTQPTQQLRDRVHRCLTQRMVVLDRQRDRDQYPPEETFQIAGSTGNVYQVHITHKSTCNCPDGIKVLNHSFGYLGNVVLTIT